MPAALIPHARYYASNSWTVVPSIFCTGGDVSGGLDGLSELQEERGGSGLRDIRDLLCWAEGKCREEDSAMGGISRAGTGEHK